MKRLFFLVILIGFSAAGGLHALERIEKISGDGQTGIEGYPLKEDFVIRVLAPDNTPVAGAPVMFTFLSPSAPGARESSLSGALSVTDAQGYGRTRLNLGASSEGEVLVVASTRGTAGNPAVFTAHSRSRHWIIVLVMGITGGLGIFLFGMFFLNDALQKLAGHKLREVLITLTSSPLRGMSTGLFVTLFNQSSSATTLLEVSLVSAGILTFAQTMAVTVGAEIGSTVTAQLVAFNLAEYAVFIAGLGFFISFVAKTKKGKHAGNALLGFGILFLGMKIMADLLVPLRSYGPFLDLMHHVENPLLGILTGLVFTMAVHSSGATAGIVIALALAGAISLPQAIPLILGAQIGTCFTAALGSIGRGREGQRVALWHVVHQTAGVLLVLPFLTLVFYRGEPAWIYFTRWFTHAVFYTDDLARQIAMSHTLAAVFNALVFYPLLPLMARFFKAVYPPSEKEKPFGPMYIDEGLLSTPSLALEQARKETVREGEIVLEMMQGTLEVFDARDLKLSETVSLMDVRADVLRNEIVPYLTRIAQSSSLSEEQSQLEIQLLYVAADLESIGDIIDKNIMPLARKKLENNLWFSDEGWKDIVDLHSRVAGNLKRAVESLRTENRELAKLAAESKPEINGFESELRKRHISRLHSGLQEALETSSVHLDLIEQLRRINSLIASVGNTLLGRIK
ncbi:MAG: Na/Pi cotransporter family protein [Endomicrobiales bacterium]